MKLMHYSHKPLLEVQSKPQDAAHGCYDKPCGLWVSVQGENDWPSWCESEEFGLDRLQLAHEITLADEAVIIYITDALEIDVFTERYGLPDGYRSKMIDWPRVASEYQGIVIAPYVWTRRLNSESSWYYGWDCASGCIWDAAAIAKVSQSLADSITVADGKV